MNACCDACSDSHIGPNWRVFRGVTLCTSCHRLAWAFSAFEEHCHRLGLTAQVAASVVRNLTRTAQRVPLAQSCVVCMLPAHFRDERGPVCSLCTFTQDPASTDAIAKKAEVK